MAQPRRDSMQSIFRIRWVLVGFAAVFSVILTANGEVLIGALVGAMAILRIVMLLRWKQRRDEMRRRYPRRFERGSRN
jgi:hypothetical protein